MIYTLTHLIRKNQSFYRCFCKLKKTPSFLGKLSFILIIFIKTWHLTYDLIVFIFNMGYRNLQTLN